SAITYTQEQKTASFLEIALFSIGCIAALAYIKLTSIHHKKALEQMQEKHKQLLNYLLDLSAERPAYEKWKHTYKIPIPELMN
ncbi:MAG: hypothetical protein Q7K43_06045, partial [Candidatus Woesearchaeota archaeon]|nr:hypothetical protein [Candidatus Woesearchaeota archaeon]